ncbi:MAG: POTRA domain-containing protein [Blastocatellia bacterium]
MIPYLLTLALWFAAPVCLADNEAASHPNKQETQLPGFKTKKPFILPPVEESETPAVKPHGMKVTLERVDLNGNTVFDEAELQALIEPYLNRPVDVAELEALRFQITQHYIQHGYINSGALIPPQKLYDGVLKIDIIEGRLNRIDIEGEGWLHPD